MKRTLRPSIEKALIITDTFLIMCMCMIEDFSIGALPFLAGVVVVIVVITKIIKKYGKVYKTWLGE